MNPEPFTYEDFEKTREELVNIILHILTREDKEFLLRLGEVTPNWDIYDFERFPAVQWKLQNLINLKNSNSEKFENLFTALKQVLNN